MRIQILLKCIIYEYKKELQKFKYTNYLGCNESSIKGVRQEVLKRLYLPTYIPLIALISCVLILKSKEEKEYNFLKILLFVIIFFIIIVSEVSLRYSAYNIKGMLFFILFPFLSFFSIYFTLIKKFNHKI